MLLRSKYVHYNQIRKEDANKFKIRKNQKLIKKTLSHKEEKMKKNFIIFLLASMAVLLSASISIACEPPGCGQINSDGYIKGNEHQHQDWNTSSSGNSANSNLNQLQKHDAYGIRLKGDFTGNIKLYSEQYAGYQKTYNLSDGGSSEHYGEGYKFMETYSEIGGKCGHLSIDGKNEYAGITNTNQGNNFMSASQNVNDKGYVRLEGEYGKSSAQLIGEHSKGYYQKDAGNNWQAGSIDTKIKINLNPKTP